MVTQSSGLRDLEDLKDSGVIGRNFLHCGDLAADSRLMSLPSSRSLIAFKEVTMYQVRTLKVLNTLPALIAMAMLAVCTNASAAGSGATLVFSYPNGFAGTSGTINLSSDANSLVGSALELTNGTIGVHEAGGVWFAAQQNITSFTTDFTFKMASGQPVPSIIGITFCVQNTGPGNPWGLYGSHASADSNMAGYGGYALADQYPLLNSIAVKFDMNSNNGNSTTYPAGGSPNSTGLYINGGPSAALNPENDLNPYGINLYSGHIMEAHIVYDGSLLTMVLKDTVTNAQARYSWPVNIPAVYWGQHGLGRIHWGRDPSDGKQHTHLDLFDRIQRAALNANI